MGPFLGIGKRLREKPSRPGIPRGLRAPAHALLLASLGLAEGCASEAAAPPPTTFEAARAWTHLETIVGFGERPSGSPAIERLRGYLEAELRAIGLQPRRESFRDSTPIGEIRFANVYADIPANAARSEPAPLVLLCTHFDTKRLPFAFEGANDGGSGTALLLELARCLVEPTRERKLSYRILFLDGEESIRPEWYGKDNTYGSRHHAARLVETGEIDRVQACVLVDMVADSDLRLTTDLESDRELLRLFFEAADEIGLGRHVGGRAKEVYDDHLSFLAVGIPSVDLIDLEFGPGNSKWHTAADRLDACSVDSLDAIGRIVLAGLEKLEQRASDG